jgi:hypothetical protein
MKWMLITGIVRFGNRRLHALEDAGFADNLPLDCYAFVVF